MMVKVILADSMDLVLAGLQAILHQETNVEVTGCHFTGENVPGDNTQSVPVDNGQSVPVSR